MDQGVLSQQLLIENYHVDNAFRVLMRDCPELAGPLVTEFFGDTARFTDRAVFVADDNGVEALQGLSCGAVHDGGLHARFFRWYALLHRRRAQT